MSDFSAGHGHYAAMVKTDTRAGYSARLVTPYINTTGKCLELFYWITVASSGSEKMRIKIIVISEELEEKELHSVSDLTLYFPKLYLRLPDGIHRIAIEGTRSKAKICTLSVDDVTIMDCARFGKMPLFWRNKTVEYHWRLQRSVSVHCLFCCCFVFYHNAADAKDNELLEIGKGTEAIYTKMFEKLKAKDCYERLRF